MRRAIMVIVATVILLLVGYAVGRRPVGPLRQAVEDVKVEFQEKEAELRTRASLAEAQGYLWQARAELLVASLDVDRNNFGNASERSARARDLLQRAAGVPGMTLDLTEVHERLEEALEKVAALDPAAKGALVQVSEALGRALDQRHA